jgi:hypothetical protein
MEETGVPETFGILVEQPSIKQTKVAERAEGSDRTSYKAATKQ